MENKLKDMFTNLWQNYFSGAELPIVFYYSDEVSENDLSDSKRENRCLIGNLNRVRNGHPFVYNSEVPGCLGGKRYSGFSETLRPNFEHFLSCGIPGKVEGEKYKKTPGLVIEFLKNNPPFKAPKKHLIFKRWDKLTENDDPEVVVFFATPDVLSGLFTLANFDRADSYGVITPMGSGCASIINIPLVESKSENPGAVLGMFDVSARPYVPANILTFAIPINRFLQMIKNMDESFLQTNSWNLVKNRI
ncbi:MAG: DUF169 domain-containing protein [Melioribacteraceae bacterium]|nr:DUF169 domain-containing protein [Melioribacteraceae bacterium]